ncbi:MAG TPA: beta-ketoacyl-ACP synthase III [Chitinophagales bacterium]|nr:beta-ketoacyl-ACP synthase III [Chitinophagales bacterium]
MKTNNNAAITAIATYYPEDILTNKMLEEMVETSNEWILDRTGIKERRILKGEGNGVSAMAIPAVKKLIEENNISPEEIDLLICCTVTPDYVFPATANIISDKCGLKNAFSYDLNAACSGFVYGLYTASQFIESGTYKKIIVVGADKMSSIIDYTNRQTCIIFGDAAGAVLVEPCSEEFGIQDAEMGTDGSGFQYLHQKAGGSVLPPSAATVEQRLHYVHQEGKSVFKVAVTKVAESVETEMKRNHLNVNDVDWFVPHQANLRIIHAVNERIGFAPERVTINIDRFGNTTNATIPLCLDEWKSKIKKGDNVILATFGGGFTWGAIYLKWAI